MNQGFCITGQHLSSMVTSTYSNSHRFSAALDRIVIVWYYHWQEVGTHFMPVISGFSGENPCCVVWKHKACIKSSSEDWNKDEIIKKSLPRNSPLLSCSVKFELLAASGAKENENWCPLYESSLSTALNVCISWNNKNKIIFKFSGPYAYLCTLGL